MSSDCERLISVVVIGLNEEERLEESLRAVFACKPDGFDLEVLYVDSGSTDRSTDIARGIAGVEVLHLSDPARSAAKARNVGLRRAKGRYVQLVDGDSVLQSGWMAASVAELERNPEVACVFGQCVEMYPDQSVYMRVCGLDWHIAPGDYRLCGGNSMWRTSVIAEHGFFDETTRIGEEPDLCYRVRQNGWRIRCVDAPMVTHDLAMRRFDQYWARAVNSGHGYSTIALRYWRRPEKLWLREMLINFAEPTGWLVLLLVGCLAFGWLGGVALLVAWWGLRTLQIAGTVLGRGLKFTDALMYAAHCQFVRIPIAIGQVKTLLRFR